MAPPPIPLSDLEAQHAPLRAELEAATRRVLGSGRFILGPEVAAFEREAAVALGTAHAVGLSSGSDALLALLMASGIGPGDEVVTTPLSFFASAGAIARLGARPVFADIDPETLNLDQRAACAALAARGARVKAVVVVHLFGRPAATAELAAACAAGGVALIEDAAQAIGAARVGRLGRAAAISFFPSKNLGGFGDGGLAITDDAALAAELRLVRAHGAREKHQHLMVGGNFRLDELQAALLRVKLPHLARWTARRRALAARYRKALGGLPLALPPEDAGCVWNQFVIRVARDRDGLRAHLAARGISSAVYYPVPLHLQPALAPLGYRAGDLPIAEQAVREVLALPIYPELSDAAADRVAEAVRSFVS
jgi:dTDP-4-amino-4,6-dideoxygalactose transaminase